MGKIIGLIACSSTKLGKDSPAKKYLAKDIYKGHTFILSTRVRDSVFPFAGKFSYNMSYILNTITKKGIIAASIKNANAINLRAPKKLYKNSSLPMILFA